MTADFQMIPIWVPGEYASSENNVDLTHLGFGPGAILPDGTRGYLNAAPLPPPIKPAPVTKQ
jgi:hypothetical protein